MTIQEFVTEELQVPVTIAGNGLIVEAIEIVFDEHSHKFYPRLSAITGKTTRQLEKLLRGAKNKSISYMTEDLKQVIFGEDNPTVTEYIVKATQYYRRRYHENQEER